MPMNPASTKNAAYIPYRTHSRIDSPTVIAGNVMWNITVMANCHRERVSRLTAAS
jgi:hypothetical protein